jgi:hypothetical protein
LVPSKNFDGRPESDVSQGIRLPPRTRRSYEKPSAIEYLEANVMSQATQDRQRTRQDLQELAKLAKATPATSFKTADSSGYVDLSAFSATDEGWVDRELERARLGMPAPARGKSAAINALSPESMAPVALSALLEAPAETPAPRGRKALYLLGGLVSVAAVAALAVSVARQAPPPVKTAAAMADVPAAAPPPQPAATPAPEATIASSPPDPTTAPSTPAVAATAAKASAAAQPPKHKTFATASHSVSAAAAPHPAPAARPVVIPQAKSSSGDSLMDMMRASVKTR